MKSLLQRSFLALAVLSVPALLVAAYADAPDAVTPDGGRFYGTLAAGVFSGEGELRYDDGRTYRGGFADGRFHGKGRLQDAEGDVYEGEFEDGELTRGSYTAKDGARYEGGFKNWRFHGEGRYADGRGTTYEGRFVDGSLEGRGKVSGHGRHYEGELKAWQFHGEGTLTYAEPREDGRTTDSGTWRYGTLSDPEGERKWLSAIERAMYEQRSMLDRALGSLQPGEPGKIELYLLTVAGDGSQEVFRREVGYVQKTFAERFGTAGRSIALINSRNTLGSAPMATVTSIRAALQAIGARMNRDEDVLFLFLTSHGSAEHELFLNQKGMRLRGLPAAELGALLEESGIRWKVVVVSACYSGGFIDAIKDERTLVITAARRDRRSFGCADENDFTYFGRAFFKEALPGAGSFQQAFEKASTLVEEWERKDKSDAHSLPQIHSPKAIQSHLERWRAQAQ